MSLGEPSLEVMRFKPLSDRRGGEGTPGDTIRVSAERGKKLVEEGLAEWIPFSESVKSPASPSHRPAEVRVEHTLEALQARFGGIREREQKLWETLAVLEKLSELGWIDGKPQVEFDENSRKAWIQVLQLRSNYSLEQIGSWAGAPIQLQAGTLEPLEGDEAEGNGVAGKLRQLGFEVRIKEGELLARRTLLTCGGRGLGSRFRFAVDVDAEG